MTPMKTKLSRRNLLFNSFLVVVVCWSSSFIGKTECICSDSTMSRKNKVGKENDFGVLIDAGSTGTRVWVYSWPRNQRRQPEDPPGPTVPPIECVYSHKVPKGLAECADDLDELRQIVLELIHEAKRHVPMELHSTTSIFLMATAGMRLLLEDKAITVVEHLDLLFRNKSLNPFLYDSPHNTRILSGEEEGVFAWIAVNYLSQRLTNIDADLYKTTSGILELGGASTQIAFIPRGSVLSDKFPVFIGGEKYPIYVHSYLHYGQDYVDKWIRRSLIRSNQSHMNNVNNPCMLKGEKLMTPENRTFVGTGDPSACVTLLERFVYKIESHQCYPKPCAIGSVYQPNIPSNQTFYTIGAFYFILKDLKVINSDGTFTPAQLYEAAFDFCSKDFEELKEELKPSPENEKFISKPCSIGLYMSLLFTQGYGFKNHTMQIIAAEKINGQPIDWTLGALIYENDYRMTSQCRKNGGEGPKRTTNVINTNKKNNSTSSRSSSSLLPWSSLSLFSLLSYCLMLICSIYL